MSVRTYKVYVGNLGDNGSKQELEREFERFGRLHDVWVARNPPGFAFVEFEDLRDAEDAIKALDGKRLCGVTVRVEMSRNRGRGGGRGSSRPDRYGGGRNRYDDRGGYDRYDDRSRSPNSVTTQTKAIQTNFHTRSPRRRGRSPEQDRWQGRDGRSRSRSPRRF